MRLSSLSKSLAGTPVRSPSFPFSLSLTLNVVNQPLSMLFHSLLYRENVSSTTSFQQFQSRSTVTAFLISPPLARFYATLLLSPFFNREWILHDSNAQRRECDIEECNCSREPFPPPSPSRVRSSPFFLLRLSPTIRPRIPAIVVVASTLVSSIFSHARILPLEITIDLTQTKTYILR